MSVRFLICLLGTLSAVSVASDALQEDIAYRKNRENWMRSEGSPLALAGLFWLRQGDNYFGTASENEIVLPAGSAPAKAGSFRVAGNEVKVVVESDVSITIGGQHISRRTIQSDSGGAQPDLLKLDRLRMKVIERGGRLALRLINLKNPALMEFRGLNFYDINPAYRVEATFKPYQPSKRIQVALITGQVEEVECPGFVDFLLDGKALRLEPIYETPKDSKFYFMFKDATNGPETYGGGRYLYSELPKNGRLVLNFNQAHNPYCAYNSYSTCLIPPTQNWLKVPVRAGEKKYSTPASTDKQAPHASTP